MQTKFISITQTDIEIDGERLTPEGLIAYCARVSSPNQENPNYKKLLEFCIRESHWSIFEQVDMGVEITTTRAIAPQILRHGKGFCFQEFSQRYSRSTTYESYEAREQDLKNRQNSTDTLSAYTKLWFKQAQEANWTDSYALYEEALERGIAKECARVLLPLNTVTRLYMKGSVRSWIHYFAVRCADATQKEHRDIAIDIRDNIFAERFPLIHSIITQSEPDLAEVKQNLKEILTTES
jgi:thymidylate synthase (FAD)